MLNKLGAPKNATVVMDCGIATKSTIEWMISEGYYYVVVSRERSRTFDINKAMLIRTAKNQDVHIYRELNNDNTEAKLYCYSQKRAEKEDAIASKFAGKFEDELRNLSDGLNKPRTKKQKDYILKRIGRIEERGKGISQHYSITVQDNAVTKAPNAPLLATSIQFEKNAVTGSIVTHPGVYCLRTNVLSLGAEEMWKKYILLTDLEAVFRSLKSELGLRPVYHQTSDRAEGHLFITVLAYQCVQVIRKRLKECEIHDSWLTVRSTLSTHHRSTKMFLHYSGATLHHRKAEIADAYQQQIYDALNLDSEPGGVVKCWINK